MTVQNQAQLEMLRSTLKKLLKAALATSCLSGVAAVASAQTGLQLPTFPTEGMALALPVPSEPISGAIEYPFPIKSDESARLVTASSKAIALLGLNKNGVAPRVPAAGVQSNQVAQASVPTFRLPVVAPAQNTPPNNTTAAAVPSVPNQPIASGLDAGHSRTPSISNSSGKNDERKVTLTATPLSTNDLASSDIAPTATINSVPNSLVDVSANGLSSNVDPVVVESEPIVLKFEDLTSTVESNEVESTPSESLIEDLAITEPVRDTSEPIREEVATAETQTDLSGSLIDIDIPTQVAQNVTAQTVDRLPAIVKTHSAMQLNFGASDKTSSADPTPAEHAGVAVANVAPTVVAEPVVAVEPTVEELVVNEPVSADRSVAIGEPVKLSIDDVAKLEPTTYTNPEPAAPIGLPESPAGVSEKLSPVLLTSDIAEKAKELSGMPRPALIATVAVMPIIDEAAPHSRVESVVQASSSVVTEDLGIAAIRAAEPVLPASEPSPSTRVQTIQGEQLKLAINDSITIESSLTIEKVSVEHPELCQALKGREHDVTLVGLRPGITRVAVFTVDRSDVRKVEIHEVSVGESGATQADAKNLASEITRTVRKMYPQSRVSVVATVDGLSVQGVASSEEEAKRIVGLARKASLQPVIDRVTVGRW